MLALLLAAGMAWAQTGYSSTAAVVHSTTGGNAQDLPATLLKPDGAGPFPAVVILHDCSGLGPRSSGAPRRWGALLASQGYVVLIPDSFLPRGYADGVCTASYSAQTMSTVRRRALSTRMRRWPICARCRSSTGAHVGVMGGSHGGAATLATLVKPSQPLLEQQRADGFAGGIALYPVCGAAYGQWYVTRKSRLARSGDGLFRHLRADGAAPHPRRRGR